MSSRPRLSREQVAARAALELHDGDCVNLGWGIPNLVSAFVPRGVTVFFHSENGILGMGPRAKAGEEDYDVVDAMKVPVTVIPGASFFDQGMAHLMSRGGHLDVSMLGGLQAAENGDFANWKIPGSKGSGGIGGAMDIATGARRLIVCMEHNARDGAPKLVRRCSYPLTALACVHRVITDLAVVDVTPEGFLLHEVAPGWTVEEVQACTEARLIVRGTVPAIALPRQ
jgi:3-oxoacid CoA-transferase subunit B